MRRLVLAMLSVLLTGFYAAHAETPSAATAEKTSGDVQAVTLYSGWFVDAACKLKGQADEFSSCYCVANIQVAQTGDAALDRELARLNDENLCKGDAVEAMDGQNANKLQTEMKVTRNDDRYLSVLYEHSTLSIGAAHSTSYYEARIYDKQAGKWLTQGDVVPVDKRQAAGKAVADAVDAKYPGRTKLRNVDPATLFSDKGCQRCVIYPAQEGGWSVVFDLYALMPYSEGMPEVRLDESFAAIK